MRSELESLCARRRAVPVWEPNRILPPVGGEGMSCAPEGPAFMLGAGVCAEGGSTARAAAAGGARSRRRRHAIGTGPCRRLSPPRGSRVTRARARRGRTRRRRRFDISSLGRPSRAASRSPRATRQCAVAVTSSRKRASPMTEGFSAREPRSFERSNGVKFWFGGSALSFIASPLSRPFQDGTSSSAPLHA